MKTLHFMKEEWIRLMIQPWIYVSVIVIMLIDILLVYGEMDWFTTILNGKKVSDTLMNSYCMNEWDNVIAYMRVSVAAFPFVMNFIQDIKSRRLHIVVLKTRCFRYAFVQVMINLCGVFMCMFIGTILFFVISHWWFHIPLGVKSSHCPFSSSLCEAGHPLRFLLLYIAMECLMACFYALLSVLVSCFVYHKTFISILPTILLYMSTFFVNSVTMPIPRFCDVKNVYMYLYAGVLFENNDIAEGLYAVFFTVCTAAIVMAVMSVRARKEAAGG